MRRADSKTNFRIKLLIGAFGILCFIVIAVRLFYLQVNQYDYYRGWAQKQQTKEITVYANRGTIYDRNMKALAVSADSYMVTLEAIKIDDDDQGLKIAAFLSETLEMDYDWMLEKVNAKATYAVIKRGVDSDTASLIRAFVKEEKLDSVYLIRDSSRYYPYGAFLSQVLGFVGTDQQGLYGLELQYDELLTGTNGRLITSVNASGDALPDSTELYYEAEDGKSLVLTVDEVLQHYLEKELEQAYADNDVQCGACGIVMDCHTGAILAMAIKNDFDPNQPQTIYDQALAASIAGISDSEERQNARLNALYNQWRNRCITDTYYPGSTFKIVVASMFLEQEANALNRGLFCSGVTNVSGTDIHCWKYYNPHGSQTLAEALQNSCNCAFMEIGQTIGAANFTKYFKAYGLDQKTGIDLPGEQSGIFFNTMGPVDLAVSSFGQGFSITPLQLITAVSAVVNGGTLYQPYIVKAIADSEGNIIDEVAPTAIRQVNSERTSELMREYVEMVVTKGTGGNAKTPGYRVAGKTGTSEKIGTSTSGKEEYVTSFIAFAPADDPQICVLVLLNEPQVQPITGGVNAAPIIRRFMADALPYLGVEPEYSEEELRNSDYTVPSFEGMTVAAAKSRISSDGVGCKVIGSGDTVTGQLPAPNSVISKQSVILLYAGSEIDTTPVVVPEVLGMSLDNARRTLENIGLYIKTEGITYSEEGKIEAIRQTLVGESVKKGTVITVEFSDVSLTSH